MSQDFFSGDLAYHIGNCSWGALSLGAAGEQHHEALPRSTHGWPPHRQVFGRVEEAIPAQSSDRNLFLSLNLRRWMGTWGAASPKGTHVWGTAQGAQSSISSDLRCQPRSWMPKLYRRLSREQRLKLKAEETVPVVIKKTRADGSVSVILCRISCT